LHGKLPAREASNVSDQYRQSARMLDLLNAGMAGFAVAGAFLSATYHPHMYVHPAPLISPRILASRRADPVSAKRTW
jgi:hypothetical protein